MKIGKEELRLSTNKDDKIVPKTKTEISKLLTIRSISKNQLYFLILEINN